MKSIPYVLSCVLCGLFFQLPSWGGDGDMNTSQSEHIRALREKIEKLQAGRDLIGLRQLVTQAKDEWLKNKSADYYPVILELCLAVNSTAPTQQELCESMRDLAVSAIDSSDNKSPEITGRLLMVI